MLKSSILRRAVFNICHIGVFLLLMLCQICEADDKKPIETAYHIDLKLEPKKAFGKNVLTLFQEDFPAKTYHYNKADFEKKKKELEQRLLKRSASHGYFDAKVTSQLKQEGDHTFKLVFTLEPGAHYHISKIIYDPTDAYLPKEALETIPLKTGKPFSSHDILQSQKELIALIDKHRCFRHIDIERKVMLHRETKKVDVYFHVLPSKHTCFGATTFQGLEHTKPAFIKKFIHYKEGDCFKASKVSAAKEAMLKTQLFSYISEELHDDAKKGAVPVTFRFKERLYRSIKGTIWGSTDEGAGLSLGWEHLNLMGWGKKVSIDSNISRKYRSLSASYKDPQFFNQKQTLELKTLYDREDLDLYQAASIKGEGVIRRQLTRSWSYGGGIHLKRSSVEENMEHKEFFIIGTPVFADYDTRDNILDPTRGMYIHSRISPSADMMKHQARYVKNQFKLQYYYQLRAAFSPVVALRGNVGSIVGDKHQDIPVNERFYAGGSSSVRGYELKSLGGEGEEAVGGRSMTELSAELRMRFNSSLGGVLFFDAGNVFKDTLPRYEEGLHYAWGVGARYFTAIGPLRFDIAFPVNKRSKIDDAYQFYVSIGQTF